MSKVDIRWLLPPTQLSIFQGEIHLWRVFLDRPALEVEQLAQLLSADERVRVERFYFEQDKNRFIVTRAFLRAILGGYLGTAAERLQFDYGQHGKPAIAESQNGSSLRFNLSHSQNLTVFAVARDRDLGVDLEFIRPIAEAEQIAKRYFSIRENAVFQALSPSQKSAGFFRHWTRKQAFLKAVGNSLAANINDFDETVLTEESRESPTRWFLHSFVPAPNYLATLAVEGNDWDIAYFQSP